MNPFLLFHIKANIKVYMCANTFKLRQDGAEMIRTLYMKSSSKIIHVGHKTDSYISYLQVSTDHDTEDAIAYSFFLFCSVLIPPSV